MKIIIASDTHGKNERLTELEKLYPDASLFLHAGDWGDDPGRYDHWITVRGNNDFHSSVQLDASRVVLAGNHAILLIHGDRLPFSRREETLADLAKANGCDIAVYGHSHRAAVSRINGVLVINPGALFRSRDVAGASYCVLDTDQPEPEAKIIRYAQRPEKDCLSEKQ